MSHMKKPSDLRQKLMGRGSMGSEVDFVEWERKANRAKKVNTSDKLRQVLMDQLHYVFYGKSTGKY